MPSGRGPATPVYRVNIVVVVELRSSPELPGIDCRGLLSPFSRTLPAKMPYLAIRETFFICRILFIMIIFISFFFFSLFFLPLGEAPRGGFLQGAGSVLEAPVFKKIVPIFFNLRQCSGRLWRQSGEAQQEVAVVALNQENGG